MLSARRAVRRRERGTAGLRPRRGELSQSLQPGVRGGVLQAGGAPSHRCRGLARHGPGNRAHPAGLSARPYTRLRAPGAPLMTAAPLLEAQALVKRYGNVIALD